MEETRKEHDTVEQLYREIHIINPIAGHRRAQDLLPASQNISVYRTKCVGDAEQFAYEACMADPCTHFYAYGGDGTFQEVITGILRAGAGATARFTPMAAGSANDFMRSLKKKDFPRDTYVDLLVCNDKYCLNMVNIGFDCRVVQHAEKYRKIPVLRGSFSYIAGIVGTLLDKMGRKLQITYTDEHDETHSITDEFLLTLCANGSYCGGGFDAVPVADLQDGLIDLLMVKNITRRKFLSIVPAYKKGTHFTPEGKIDEKYASILSHVRCKEVTITSDESHCIDGEIHTEKTVHISILPRALHLVLPDNDAQQK
jgi:diacylglycerol kinase family enzyme